MSEVAKLKNGRFQSPNRLRVRFPSEPGGGPSAPSVVCSENAARAALSMDGPAPLSITQLPAHLAHAGNPFARRSFYRQPFSRREETRAINNRGIAGRERSSRILRSADALVYRRTAGGNSRQPRRKSPGNNEGDYLRLFSRAEAASVNKRELHGGASTRRDPAG